MGRGQTRTWLPLDRWAAIIGIHPFSFNQLFSDSLSPPSNCGEIWYQHTYQHPDNASREDVADAIREAETRLASVLGYFMLPDWIEGERVKTIRPARPELYGGMAGNVRGQAKSVELRWGMVISGGQKAKDVIEAGVTANGAALSDLDGDGYSETVTLSVTVEAGTEACEVRVFYPEGGVVPSAANDTYEVRPIRVEVSGTTATITFKRWQIVDPDEQERLDARDQTLDPAVDASYLTTVDVYRVWNDPQAPLTLLWDRSGPLACASCGGSGCIACGFSSQAGCILVRDERLGFVAYMPASWDADNEQFSLSTYAVCRDPDQLLVNYYSGYRSDDPAVDCPTIQMDPFFENIVAYYAAALLDKDVCSCNNSERFVDHWREDLARVGREVSHQVTPGQLENPLGSTRGAINAWNKINTMDWRIRK